MDANEQVRMLVREVDAIRMSISLTNEEKAERIAQLEQQIKTIRPEPVKHTGRGAFGQRRGGQ